MRVQPPELRLRPFLSHAVAEYLSIERGAIPSLRSLFLRPGSLTVEFREGRGGGYTPPLRLYLATAFAYWGGLTLAGVDALYFWSLIVTLSSGGLPGWVSQVILGGVPLVAILARLVFVRTGRTFVEFLVFALYFHGFLFLIGIPFTLLMEYVPAVSAVVQRPNNWFAVIAGAWLFLGLRRVTGVGRIWCFVGTVLITGLYLATMLLGIFLWLGGGGDSLNSAPSTGATSPESVYSSPSVTNGSTVAVRHAGTRRAQRDEPEQRPDEHFASETIPTISIRPSRRPRSSGAFAHRSRIQIEAS